MKKKEEYEKNEVNSAWLDAALEEMQLSPKSQSNSGPAKITRGPRRSKGSAQCLTPKSLLAFWILQRPWQQ